MKLIRLQEQIAENTCIHQDIAQDIIPHMKDGEDMAEQHQAQDQQAQQRQHDHRPHKAPLFAHGTEDEVGMPLGHEPVLDLRTL